MNNSRVRERTPIRKSRNLTDLLAKLPKSQLDQIKKLKKLSTPKKIQDFLDRIPLNWEKNGETYMSVVRTLGIHKAHCLEGALIAAFAFWMNGQSPLIMDLKSVNGDDHIVALFKQGGRWGAISKTNHAVLRFRDPVYKTVRELAMSYFHEYIHTKTGQKILESYSAPFDLRKVNSEWVYGTEELFWLAEAIDESKHFKIYPRENKKYLRKSDHMELKAGNIIEWKKSDRRT